MKIAVTYEDGNVFQHFGHTENIKIYDIREDGIITSDVIDAAGHGHEAMAGFLAGLGVDTVICGGLGDGAKNALDMAGIEVVSGVEGAADDAVDAYLKGELESAGVNCDHHGHDEEEGCGGGCGGCGGGCGGCGGGCGSALPPFDGPNVGKICLAHYRGTFNDGTVFDSSYDRGEPLEFVCGGGMMILGFDKAVATMQVGDKVEIHLMPEEAYGEKDPRAIFTIDVHQMPGSEELEVGQQVYLSNAFGQQFPVTVTEREGDSITFDANHEMAGKELNFLIELVEVRE